MRFSASDTGSLKWDSIWTIRGTMDILRQTLETLKILILEWEKTVSYKSSRNSPNKVKQKSCKAKSLLKWVKRKINYINYFDNPNCENGLQRKHQAVYFLDFGPSPPSRQSQFHFRFLFATAVNLIRTSGWVQGRPSPLGSPGARS